MRFPQPVVVHHRRPRFLLVSSKESAATGIGTLLYARKIATTEQGSSGFADWNEQLSRLLEVRLKSSLKTPRSLEQYRGARWSPDHVVNGLHRCARNRPRVNDFRPSASVIKQSFEPAGRKLHISSGVADFAMAQVRLDQPKVGASFRRRKRSAR